MGERPIHCRDYVRYIFVVCLVVAVGYPLVNVFAVFPAFGRLLVKNTEEEAVRLADYLAAKVITADAGLRSFAELAAILGEVEAKFPVEEIKVFSSQGQVLYSSDRQEIGSLNRHDYFADIVAKGKTLTVTVQKDKQTLEGRVVAADVVEVYVPMVVDGAFLGAFEIYYDITARNQALKKTISRATLIPIFLMMFFLLVVVLVLLARDSTKLEAPTDQAPLVLVSPFHFLLIAALVVFVSEWLVMLLLGRGAFGVSSSDALLDAALLVMLVAPVLYFLLGRPLMAHIAERRKIERLLAEAKKAAEAGNLAKGEFLANMSHEIRTPLNVILGMNDLALQGELAPEQRRYLTASRQSSEALLQLINDILDFSKIEAGQLELEERPFDLGLVMDSVLGGFAAQAEMKGLDLRGVIRPGVHAALLGDESRLRQVLVNLVGNAVKFTGQGRVEVSVEAVAEDVDQVELRFAVSDTGPGIAEAVRGKIFASFSQADNSITRRFGGTGLGLAISRRLVDLLGGEIWLESEPEHGSTFYFTAQFGKADQLPAVSEQADATGVELPPLDLLLVEDNAFNQELAVVLLEDRGHRVTVAANGRLALQALSRQDFDAVLMDVQMPEMDGLAATRVIRECEAGSAADPDYRELATRLRGKHLPIIAMTAAAFAEDRENCFAAGMDAFVTKPFRAEELFRELGVFCARPATPGMGK